MQSSLRFGRIGLFFTLASVLASCGSGTTAPSDGSDIDAHLDGSSDAGFDVARADRACQSAADCDDHNFCNGVEQCVLSRDGGTNVCAPAVSLPCSAGMMCDPTAQTCRAGDAALEAGDPCDQDGDGHAAATLQCGGDDCDDNDKFRHPRALEFCDGTLQDGRSAADHDEDCDPCTVFSTTTDGDGDADHDGAPASRCSNPWLTSSRPVGCNMAVVNIIDGSSGSRGTVVGNDCNDDPGPIPGAADAGVPDGGHTLTGTDIHPGAGETCNGIDDNCNGQTDEGLPTQTMYPDCDGDGHGDGNSPGVMVCAPGFAPRCHGHAALADHTDCNDDDSAVFQGVSGYPDNDGDFYCSGAAMTVCAGATLPPGYSDHCIAPTDCNDNDGTVFASETGFPDADSDGHCASATMQTFCTSGSLPAGFTATCPQGTSDCDDNNGAAYQVLNCFPDADGDGHCNGSTPAAVCTGVACPAGTALNCPQGNSDCDDTNGLTFQVLSCYIDGDGDGHCASGAPSPVCSGTACPPGQRTDCPLGTSDCNDGNGFVYQNLTCYADADGDGHCNGGGSNQRCTGSACPGGETTSCRNGTSDCNDSDGSVYYAQTCYTDRDGDFVCANGSCAPNPTRCTAGPGVCPAGESPDCHNGCNDCNDGDANQRVLVTCAYDVDRDGHCGGQNQYCALPNDCGTASTLFGIRLVDPNFCAQDDCDDANPYAPSSAINGVPGWTFDSACGRARYNDVRHGHCCGITCPQSNPYRFSVIGGACPAGYAFVGCSDIHYSGTGAHVVTNNDPNPGDCTITQYCNGIDGTDDQIQYVCQPSP